MIVQGNCIIALGSIGLIACGIINTVIYRDGRQHFTSIRGAGKTDTQGINVTTGRYTGWGGTGQGGCAAADR